MLTIDEYFNSSSKSPYVERRGTVKFIIEDSGSKMVKMVESKVVKSYEEAIQHFQEMLNRGEEGTIIKNPSAGWKDGKPNWQVKVKLELKGIDLKITGFNYGTGKNVELISSVNCETSCGKLKTRPTGIKEKDMKKITANQQSLLGTVVEVKCSGISQDSEGNYSLLHPVYKCLRDDKTTCNSLEEIIKMELNAKGLRK